MHRPHTVGMIGIGHIGMAITEELLAEAIEVHGYSQPLNSLFKVRGGDPCETARAVALKAKTIFCCLPDERAAQDVYGGPHGLLAGLGPDHIVLDLASYSLAFKLELSDRVAATGACLVDGEVSGTPDMLRSHSASFFLSGNADACERLLGLCHLVTDQVFVLGAFGAATKMKLINNLLSAVHTAAAAEAMSLGVKAGFDPRLLERVLCAGSGSSKFLISRAPLMADRSYSYSTGTLKLFEKYLHHIPELSQEAGASTPLFDAAKGLFETALSQGRGAQDIAVVYEVIAAMDGSRGMTPADRIAHDG